MDTAQPGKRASTPTMLIMLPSVCPYLDLEDHDVLRVVHARLAVLPLRAELHL